MAVETKATKRESAYQDSPKGDQRCDNCTKFEEPDGCTEVEGKIAPQGWCKLYEGDAER